MKERLPEEAMVIPRPGTPPSSGKNLLRLVVICRLYTYKRPPKELDLFRLL